MSYQPGSGPVLIMRQGPQPNSAFSLNKDVITIGRAPGNDLIVEDADVSRSHARLVRSGNEWVLEDLGSANGTFVNGQRISGAGPADRRGRRSLWATMSSSACRARLSRLPTRPAPPAPPPGRKGGFPWLLAGIAVGGLLLLLVLAGLAAYVVLSRRPGRRGVDLAALAAAGLGPDVALQEPANNTQVNLGEEVLVFALGAPRKGREPDGIVG